jgi:hypothetical protein
LSTLQIVGVVDVHRPSCDEEVESSVALAMPVSGVLDAAERQMQFSADGGRSAAKRAFAEWRLVPAPNVRKSSTEPLSPSVDAVDQEQRLAAIWP